MALRESTGPAEITKATLESVCYQTSDLLNAISKDLGDHKLSAIRVDGGMAASNWDNANAFRFASAPS
jgi:glycerol kinase